MNVFIPSSGLETHTPTTVGIVDCGKVFFCCKIQHPGRHMDTIRGCRISFVSKTRPPIYPTRHSVGLDTLAIATCVLEARHLTWGCSVPPARPA